MIEVIDTKEKLSKLIMDFDYIEGIGRYRNYYLYRGLSRKEYKLTTSLQRNCGDVTEPETIKRWKDCFYLISVNMHQ